MRYFWLIVLGMGALFPMKGNAQVGEKVPMVKVLTVNNDTVSLPYLGQKNLLIFYADPSHPRQNKDLRNYFRTHPIKGNMLVSYGVVNLAAAPMIPNALIRRKAAKEVEGTDGQIYFDPDNALTDAWKLPGADRGFVILFVNKDGIIEFYKAGQLTSQEKEQVLGLVHQAEEER